MTNTYQIGSEYFKTQKELVERVRSILHDPNNFRKAMACTDDIEFLKELLTFHKDAKDKFKDGIIKIWVDKNKGGTKSFYIERRDGEQRTKDDFSCGECIKGYPNKKI
jgi:uncharacterized protein DUF3223